MAKIVTVETTGPGLVDITHLVADHLAAIGARDGLVSLFIQHTSASLTIQENADPDVLRDLVDHFARLAPTSAPYRHTAEGPDDMPAHIKSVLSDTALTVPVADGRMLLGVWQGVYVFEHRDRPHARRVVITFAPCA